MPYTDSQLRKLASQLGARRARLLSKLQHASVTSEERLQPLKTTLDYADIRKAQGMHTSAQDLLLSAVKIAKGVAICGGQAQEQLLRLPETLAPSTRKRENVSTGLLAS